jgi:hypothetical protein
MNGRVRSIFRLVLPAIACVAVALLPATLNAQETSCIQCHADVDLFEEEAALVESHAGGIHAEYGLSCHDCHGGNPDPALFEDMDLAMDEGYAPAPYRGAPDVEEVPGFCGTCHSDAAYMRRFRPDARVDQVAEYLTSRHGLGLAAGDTAVATCTSCHGVHGMRPSSDPQSRVHPTRVGATCSECHADAERMAGYLTDEGRPLPVTQYALWQQSVHAASMFDREDLSAPTCNDCHGNHGAAPPGVESVNFVCGQCHGREASLFRQSPKREAFEEHAEYLLDAGEEGCAACHAEPEPQAGITMTHLGECASCHGNHGIVRPSLAMLSPLPETPCAFCHEGVGGVAIGDLEASVTAYEDRRGTLLSEAEELGLAGNARFDWLIDRARSLPQHGGEGEGTEGSGAGAEFARLYDKFRIGKTTYTYTDPTTEEQAERQVLRCASCHASPEELGEDAIGYTVSATILENMRSLTARTAAAERMLLRAKRGGVETGDALLSIDQSIDAQIGLEVLLHSFAVGEDSEFVAQHLEGLAHASEASMAGESALEELWSRRQGLFVALALIALVLLGLYLKIREISARQQDA